MSDLWPAEFGDLTVTPPLVILKEQAVAITGKTRQRIYGQVNTTQLGQGFAHTFSLQPPSLDNYTYALFNATHGVMLYPVEITNYATGAKTQCANPEALIQALKDLFASEHTRKVVAAILAQTDAVAK